MKKMGGFARRAADPMEFRVFPPKFAPCFHENSGSLSQVYARRADHTKRIIARRVWSWREPFSIHSIQGIHELFRGHASLHKCSAHKMRWDLNEIRFFEFEPHPIAISGGEKGSFEAVSAALQKHDVMLKVCVRR